MVSLRRAEGEATLISRAGEPGLSIVVPVLNEAASLADRLARLAPLRAGGAQVIVVDGGSEDATAASAARLAECVLVAPRGRARQMNAGAARATGDVLLFLHADTILPPNAAAEIARAIAAGAVWGRFDVRILGQSALLPLVAAAMNLRSRLTGVATGDQAIFVRRDVFERIGGFADLALMEDIALSRALKRIGAPACLTSRVETSGRRWDANGAAKTILLMWSLRLRYFFGADTDDLARRYGYRAHD